ncbi:hypothetical protein Vretimale_779 [Volvox reticuliferus]|uniref:Uncharacterized protein n=1 Tax=Volvox reticuliferus TaxID=1737510 RepID=A0A8J4D3X9_9CHLO|nr:hypothetical protein Vretifemale_2089 [Volvox reticuliferus]GIL94554.1 hypothetical protein Vretimale_779 [Volvox reticuliferus]
MPTVWSPLPPAPPAYGSGTYSLARVRTTAPVVIGGRLTGGNAADGSPTGGLSQLYIVGLASRAGGVGSAVLQRAGIDVRMGKGARIGAWLWLLLWLREPIVSVVTRQAARPAMALLIPTGELAAAPM